MDTHAATAGLEAVHDEVVGVAAHGQRVGVETINVLLDRLCERLVLGGVGLALVIPVEQREVDDPQEVVPLARDVEGVGHVAAHAAEDFVGGEARAGGEHHEVARLHLGALAELGHLLVGEELDDRRVDRAVLTKGNPGQTLGAKRLGDGLELVDLRAGPAAGALGVDALDDRALLVGGAGEHLELGVLEHVGDVDEVHAVARVGLVDAVGVHRVPVRDAAQRRRQLDAHAAERVLEHVLERAHDVVLVDEAHLDVDLRELGLAVGAKVLVAEALGHLVVALDATHHEQLLEQLRALRQCVEVARLDAAGHEEVARTLGRGLEQARRLDLHEGALVQRLADGEGEVGAELEVAHHLRATDVEVAVAQARVLGRVDAVLNLEGRRLGAVEHLDGVDADLDLAGGELGVDGLGVTAAHDSLDQDGPLGTDDLGRVEGGATGVLGVEGALRHAGAVAQVDEDEPAVVATTPHPAGERDLLADVLAAELAGGARVQRVLVHGRELLERGEGGLVGLGLDALDCGGAGFLHVWDSSRLCHPVPVRMARASRRTVA